MQPTSSASDLAIPKSQTPIPTSFYDVTCGKCNKTEQTVEARSSRHAQRELRVLGWEKQERHGWVCPACVKSSPLCMLSGSDNA